MAAFEIPPSVYTRFFAACKSGNIEKIKTYIARGGDVTIDDNLAIRCSAMHGRLEAVKCLVGLGADVRAMDDCSVAWAARRGHLSVVKFLVEKGANPSMYNYEALRWASAHGHFEIAKYLVTQCGSNVQCVSAKCLEYIIFCQRMEEKKRLRAQKKIYFWWIERCYDLERECGKRMALKNFMEFLRLEDTNLI